MCALPQAVSDCFCLSDFGPTRPVFSPFAPTRSVGRNMRASKSRVASKGSRVATYEERSASSLADTQQQSARGMSSELQGALATVVLLGTVVLLMGSSLRQVSQTAILDATSQATSVAASLPTDATSRKPGQVEMLQRFRALQAERGQAAPVATVELPPPVSTPPSKPSCLITKWGAIWLMQISNSERRHVQHPIDGCESKALTVQDEHLDRFPKVRVRLRVRVKVRVRVRR